MKARYTLSLVLFSSLLLMVGCANKQTDARSEIVHLESSQHDAADFEIDELAPDKEELRELFFADKTKRKLAGGINHYQFEVRLGPGPYDVVRIHRVVRERRPYRPVETSGNVFMVHGSSQDFGDIFLYAGIENPTPQTSVPLYLAEKGVDVWGIDLAWTMVPEETDDLSFMKDWGIERDVDHILAAMSIARFLRGLTGQGFGRMNLLGFSYSSGLAYIAAARETQQDSLRRDINGLVTIDAGLYVEDENRRQIACQRAASGRNEIQNGNYYSSMNRLPVIHELATDAPDASSPLKPFSGFTNYQAALLVGMSPPFWNFVGVELNADGVPVDLLYADPDRWIELLGGAPPNTSYQPRLGGVQLDEIRCGEKEVAVDDHLPEIAVPILYIAAGGGFGEEEGRWTTSHTASNDISIYEVSLQPESRRAFDFGHADLFIAENAPELVWERLRNWLVDHQSRPLSPIR